MTHIMDELEEAISVSYEKLNPSMEKNQWTIIQLEALLDNILLDYPELESYYKNFVDTTKLL